MTTRRLAPAAMLLIAAAGCDRKAAPNQGSPAAAPPSANVPPSRDTDAPAPPRLAAAVPSPAAAVPPDAAAPPPDAPATLGPPASVAVGATPRGCVGWADAAPSAACVVGELLERGPNLRLAFLGVETPSRPLAARLDADAVARVNAALADGGYVAMPGEPTPLVPGQPLVRGGVTLMLESHPAAPSGSGAPVSLLRVRVTCGGRDTDLINDYLEDTTLEASVRSIGARLVIELTQHVARGTLYGATVLDTATCRFGSER